MKESTTMNETISKARNIIKNAGATHVYIFGSRANGTHTEASDYDFGVKGLPPYMFFRTWSQLEKELGIKTDLDTRITLIPYSFVL